MPLNSYQNPPEAKGLGFRQKYLRNRHARINGRESDKRRLCARTGYMLAPQIDWTEALCREIDHFLHCIEHATEPERGGGAGLRVVEIMRPASQSMARRSPGGVTTHFPAGDGMDPQSRMQ